MFQERFKDVLFCNTSLAKKGELAHRLQHLTTWLIQNGRRGLKISFLIRGTVLLENVVTEKRTGRRKEW